MTVSNLCDLYSMLIETQQNINIIQNNLTDTNQNLLSKINKTLPLSQQYLIIEVRGEVITIDKNDANYTTSFYQEILTDNQRLISRNQQLIETNELFLINKELLFSSNEEIGNQSRDLFLQNQNITLNNFELIRKNHLLISMHQFPPFIFPEVPKKSREAIDSTLERIVISSQLLILSRISTNRPISMQMVPYS